MNSKNSIWLFVISIIAFSILDSCKEQRKADINNDGGVSIVLEASIADIIRSRCTDNSDTTINKALIKSAGIKLTSKKSFAEIFVTELYKNSNNNTALSFIPRFEGLQENASSADCLKYLLQQTDDTMEKLKQVLLRRVNKFGIENSIIQIIGNDGRILVQLPGVAPSTRLNNLLLASGKLEFWETYDNKEIFPLLDKINKELKNILLEKYPESIIKKIDNPLNADSSMSLSKQLSLAKSAESDSLTVLRSLKIENPLFAVLSPAISRNEKGQSVLNNGPVVGFAAITDTGKINAYLRDTKIKSMFKPYTKFLWEFKTFRKEEYFLDLVAVDGTRGKGKAPLSGNIITEAHKVIYKKSSSPTISIRMTPDAAVVWGQLTKENIGKSIAIVLNNCVYSYPTVQGEISGGESSITGTFSQEEADDFVNLLNANSLPAKLTILQTQVIAPLSKQ